MRNRTRWNLSPLARVRAELDAERGPQEATAHELELRAFERFQREHAEHTHRCGQCGRGYSPARGEGPCTRRPCDGGIFTRVRRPQCRSRLSDFCTSYLDPGAIERRDEVCTECQRRLASVTRG